MIECIIVIDFKIEIGEAVRTTVVRSHPTKVFYVKSRVGSRRYILIT